MKKVPHYIHKFWARHSHRADDFHLQDQEYLLQDLTAAGVSNECIEKVKDWTESIKADAHLALRFSDYINIAIHFLNHECRC